MFALPPKADIRQRIEHVCFVPIEDLRQSATDGNHRPCGLVQHWLMLRRRLLDKTCGDMMPTSSHDEQAHLCLASLLSPGSPFPFSCIGRSPQTSGVLFWRGPEPRQGCSAMEVLTKPQDGGRGTLRRFHRASGCLPLAAREHHRTRCSCL